MRLLHYVRVTGVPLLVKLLRLIPWRLPMATSVHDAPLEFVKCLQIALPVASLLS